MSSTTGLPVSFAVAVHNEAGIVLSALERIKVNLERILGQSGYEILIVENGSTDETAAVLSQIDDDLVKVLFLKDKGYGLAMREAILRAKFDYLAFTAIDLPFGFSDLERALAIWPEYDIIFGSKAHPESWYQSGLRRSISSKIYRFLLKLFFDLKIRDSQGSIFLKKKSVLPLLKFCNSANAFFASQLAIYGQHLGLKMLEIPVFTDPLGVKRRSRYSIWRDGWVVLRSLVREYLIFRKLKLRRGLS